jgi:acid phosphatase (class A)
LIALTLSEVVESQGTKRLLEKLADRITKNREIAGVHYESDGACGKRIAQRAFEILKDECDLFKETLQAAKDEYRSTTS